MTFLQPSKYLETSNFQGFLRSREDYILRSADNVGELGFMGVEEL
jgi:hypothetical protein